MVVVLSGCYKVDVNLSVKSDDTVSGKMLLTVSKKAVDKLDNGESRKSGEYDIDFFFEGAFDRFPQGTVVETYEDSEYVGKSVEFRNIPFSDFNIAEDPNSIDQTELSFTREGDKVRAVIVLDLLERSDFVVKTDEMPSFSMKIAFPGPVVDGNGAAGADKKTMVWEFEGEEGTQKFWAVGFAETQNTTVVTQEKGKGLLFLAGGLGVFAVAAAGLAVWLFRQSEDEDQ